jgi:hypothetical protein
MASHGELTEERKEGEEKGVRASYRGGGARRDAKERRDGHMGSASIRQVRPMLLCVHERRKGRGERKEKLEK